MEGAMFRFILLVLLAAVGFYVAWPAYTGYRIHRALEAGNQPALEATIDFPSVRQSMRGPVIRQVDRRIEAVMRDLGPATKAVADQIPRDKIEQVIDGALATVVTPPQVIDIYAKGGNYNAAIKEAIMAEIDKIGGLPALLGLGKALAGSGEQAVGTEEAASIGGFKIPGELAELLQNKEVANALGGLAGKIGLDPAKLADHLFPPPKQTEPGNGRTGEFGFGNIKGFGFAGPTAMRLSVAKSAASADPDVTTEIAFKNYDWRVTKVIPDLLDR
jgi:hypothetical protein